MPRSFASRACPTNRSNPARPRGFNGVAPLAGTSAIRVAGLSVAAAVPLSAAGAIPAYADNCSGLSDCSFGIKVALVLAAILLVLLAAYFLAPLLASQAALALSRLALMNALRTAGVRFTQAAVVGIARTVTGRLVWLERGTAAAGLTHIIQGHGSQFAQWGLRTGPQIANFIMNTVRTGTPIATHPGGAADYAVRVGNTIRVVRIVIGSNGFIVTAHPLPY